MGKILKWKSRISPSIGAWMIWNVEGFKSKNVQIPDDFVSWPFTCLHYLSYLYIYVYIGILFIHVHTNGNVVKGIG